MKYTKIILGSVIVIAFFVSVLLMLPGMKQNVASSTQTALPSIVNWVSSAKTVNELTLESNLIVRVRVAKAPAPRILRNELPLLNQKNTVIATEIDESLFSDTAFEVLQVYTGKLRKEILVMQTGGINPARPNNIEEFADDPLYKVGEEYILFLVDISDDPIQAAGRELYRIVNPAGRYKINDKKASSYGENLDGAVFPTSLVDLEAQIEQAVKSKSP